MSRDQDRASEFEAEAVPEPGPLPPAGKVLDASVEPLISLLICSPRYSAVSLADIRCMIDDAVRNRCIVKATSGVSEGLILWAAVNADFDDELANCAGPEAMALKKEAWRSGEALWILEVCTERQSTVPRLVDAFIAAAGERRVRLGRGVLPPPAEPAANRTPSIRTPPAWFNSLDAHVELITPRNVLRRLVPQDAEHVAQWLSSDRMKTALGSPREDRTVEATRELISSARDRGHLLVAFAPLLRGQPEGFFMISAAEEEDVACLSLATGDRYLLQQEDAVDGTCALISWLFNRSTVNCVSSRVFGGNRVVVNWFKRYWPKDALKGAIPGVLPTVLDFRITKDAWPATLAALQKQHEVRPWRVTK